MSVHPGIALAQQAIEAEKLEFIRQLITTNDVPEPKTFTIP